MWHFLLDSLLDPLFLIGLCIGSLYLYLTSTFDFWEKRNVPFEKPIVLFGNYASLLLFRKSQAEGIKELYDRFAGERFFGVFRVRSPILVVRDPDLVKNICVKDFGCFSNRGIPINNSEDPLIGHLFNLEGRKWKGLRTKLRPTFSPSKLRSMFYLLVECSQEFEKLIYKATSVDRTVDVRELATKFTIDVIGSCAFGIQINAIANEDSEFHKAAKKLSKPSLKAALWRMLRVEMPKLYKLFGVQVIDQEITTFFVKVVSQMIKERERNGIERNDYMDLLVKLKNKGNLENDSDRTYTDEEKEAAKEFEMTESSIAAQAFVFFAAGNETSANTIAFCLYELALNPDIQERARQNILEAIENENGKLTYDAVQNMKYVDMVVLETLRKYPPAVFLSRKSENEYEIPGTEVKIPAGLRVIIPIYGIHRDPEHYPEPDVFDPNRFTSENKRTRHPYTFLPFGEGPRNCIGMPFGMLQTKMGVISFLLNHRVEACEKTNIPMTFSKRSFVTTSEKGFWLKIEPYQ